MSKAISLRQPWASLVVHGRKTIETRSWSTPYRGPLLIHASKRWTRADRGLCYTVAFWAQLRHIGMTDATRDLPRGCVIGRVELVNVREIVADDFTGRPPTTMLQPPGIELLLGDYTPGRFGWTLANPVVFARPMYCAGALGLFDLGPQELGLS